MLYLTGAARFHIPLAGVVGAGVAAGPGDHHLGHHVANLRPAQLRLATGAGHDSNSFHLLITSLVFFLVE